MMQFLSRLFSLSNVQEVLLVGRIPEDLGGLGQGVLELRPSRRLEDVSSLEALLEDDRPTVAMLLVSQGLPSGILVNKDSEAVLSEAWWRSSEYYQVFLFCFSCFSADYLTISNIGGLVHGAIGFEGPIWISVSDGGRHLVPFLKKVKRIIQRNGNSFEQSFGDIIREYVQLIRKRLDRKDSGGEAYLRRVCMVRQMTQMRLLPTRGRL